MARPSREAIETFMSITGAAESVAVQKLEEHGGDLNEAVNAHFGEGDRNRAREAPVAATQDDLMDIDDPIETIPREPPPPLFPSRLRNPFSILDPNLGPSLVAHNSDPFARAPFVTQPREVREVPIEFKDGNEPSGPSSNAPTIEDVTETVHGNDPGTRGTVIIEDENDDDILHAPTARNRLRNEPIQDIVGDTFHFRNARPSAPAYDTFPDFHNDIEEEMVRAAIEASRKDVEEKGYHAPGQRQPQLEDELEHAVTMSLKTAEEENLLREGAQNIEVGASRATDKGQQKIETPNGRFEAGGSSFLDETEDIEEQPLVRHTSRRVVSGSTEAHEDDEGIDTGLSSSPVRQSSESRRPSNGNAFPSDEWGGISSEEHDEAVMLEAAMFGGIPETGYHHSVYGPHQFSQSEDSYAHRIPRPPSPSLQAQRLIREQQDDEYLASLQADREKEMKVMREAEARRLEEEAAKRAALEKERQKQEEARRKMEEEQELERQLAAKEALLPKEPAADEENAITLLVKMPDGSRRGRRFLKSDKLQSLFDFIDIGRSVKPGTYRVVRPYPRRPFSDGESALTLNQLGLTSKQEALFLELI